LAVARAVIWSSLVDDPSSDDSLSLEEQESERQRLFEILERLVAWDGFTDCNVPREARAEIDRCFPGGAPPVLDPFGGGGAIPLEAQRLGLRALSGDLNPVPVLIQRAMLEIPSRFAGSPSIHPDLTNSLTTWQGAQGLAQDVAAYGDWLCDEVKRRIGHLYPDVRDADGTLCTPLAWIWARTVESPDPSWKGHVPLVASWILARAPKKPTIWVEPIVDQYSQSISYAVREGGAPSDRTMGRGGGVCIATGATISLEYVQGEARAGRLGDALIAVVADGQGGRRYVSPTAEQQDAAAVPMPSWKPESQLPDKGLGFRVQPYGVTEWWQLYTPRQLTALTCFSDVLADLRQKVVVDALAAGMSPDETRLRDGGSGAAAYADGVSTYLAFAIDKCADHWSNACAWHNSHSPQVRNVFARQAISMTWDYAEANPFSGRLASWRSMMRGLVGAISEFAGACLPSEAAAVAQRDARARVAECPGVVISTDPPYYDNVGYADLSDFFFVWLRRNLGEIWPDECATLLTPKASELIADPGRHGGVRGAEKFFEGGMAEFMSNVAQSQADGVPATIYYAYKATETNDGEIRSTGWDTFLQAVVDAGLQVNSTWPVRTELANRMRGLGSNALASSIVLACRPRSEDAALSSRGEFVAALRQELPDAVRLLQTGNIAPVDMAQSAIGPGIKVFSRYAKVVEANGSSMSVSAALAIINDVLGEILDGEEAELDADTRFASAWYSQYGYEAGLSGEADGLARAKNTSIGGIEGAGIGEARAGKFRLFRRSELDMAWSPLDDDRLTVWEATQHLAAALDRSETEAADLLRRLGGYGDRARQLAYLLFQKATEKGWADEAGTYNGLIIAWPILQSMGSGSDRDQQQQLL